MNQRNEERVQDHLKQLRADTRAVKEANEQLRRDLERSTRQGA